MSLALGSGTTTKREMFWIILLMLLVILAFNKAFGKASQPTPTIRQPKTPVVRQVCMVSRGMPVCVILGTFPDNPQGWDAR